MLKNYEIIQIYETLNAINLDKASVPFMFATSMNKKTLKSTYESLDELRKPSEEMMEFFQKEVKLYEEYSIKDENGKVQTQPINGDIVEFIIDETKKEDLNKKLDALKKEYESLLIEHNKKIEEFKSLLEKDSQIKDLYTLTIENVPVNIQAKQMDVLAGLMIL